MSAIRYRITGSMEDMLGAEHLQQVVWGMSPADTLSAATMRWMVHIGGLLISAWDNQTMVGFCIASVGKRENKWILWSDMAGIHPDYQGQNIGYTLKQKQKIWASEQGYEEIRWTFDPMQRGNAYFNFHKLGVISYQYHPAFYGAMQDDINRGLPADRLEAIWSTSENAVAKPTINPSAPFLVSHTNGEINIAKLDEKQVCIEIPYNLKLLKQNNLELAIKWQKSVCLACLDYFQNGYQVVNFHKSDANAWYILQKNI